MPLFIRMAMTMHAATLANECLYLAHLSIIPRSGRMFRRCSALAVVLRQCLSTPIAWVLARISKSRLCGWDFNRDIASSTLPRCASRRWQRGQLAMWFCIQCRSGLKLSASSRSTRSLSCLQQVFPLRGPHIITLFPFSSRRPKAGLLCICKLSRSQP